MQKVAEVTQKKLMLSSSLLLLLAVPSGTLPALAARHGIHAVWVAIPLVLLESVAMVYTIVAAHELQQVKKAP